MVRNGSTQKLERKYHLWTLLHSPAQLVIILLLFIRGADTILLLSAAGLTAIALGFLIFHIRPAGSSASFKPRLRPADKISLSRCIFAFVLVSIMLIDPQAAPYTSYAPYAAFAVGALSTILDGFDGVLARRHGPTRFGEILDIEGDTAFVQLAAISAIAELGAPKLLILLTAWRYLYVLSLKIIPNPGTVPSSWQIPMKTVGVLGMTALGSWFLLFIPREAARWYTYVVIIINALSFFMNWYYHLRWRNKDKGKSNERSSFEGNR